MVFTNNWVSWEAPPESVIKLNIDGFLIGNSGGAGFGGLFKNHLGSWLHGFHGFLRRATNIQAEL